MILHVGKGMGKTGIQTCETRVYWFLFLFLHLPIDCLVACCFSSVQSLSRVRHFATPWTATRQASLSSPTPSLLKFMSVESVMPSNHLIFCHPLLLLPSIFSSISLHIFVYFPSLFLKLISNSYTIVVKKDTWDYFSLLNFLRFSLWPNMWSILENVSCAFEKNVFCCSSMKYSVYTY